MSKAPTLSRDTLSSAGQITIDGIHIKPLNASSSQGVDVSNMFERINIYEDVFSNTLSGSIVLNDSLNLLSHLPIVGREEIEITFRTPGLQKNRVTFRSFKVSAKTQNDTDNNQMYTVEFVSVEQFTNLENRLSRSFKGKISEVAKTVFKKLSKEDKKVDIEDTLNSYQFIACNWTPLRILNWLAAKALPISNPYAPNYMVFETLDGFKFVSLNSLYNQAPSVTYTRRLQTSVSSDEREKDSNTALRTIESLSFGPIFDTLAHSSNGAESSTLYSYDLTKKEFKVRSFDHIDGFARTNHLEKHPISPRASKQQPTKVRYVPDQSFSYSDKVSDNEKWAQRVAQRGALLQQLEHFSYNIMVPGDSDRRVGETVRLDIPSPESLEGDKDWRDRHMSGKFLVTGIHHVILPGEYKQKIEVRSESLRKPLADTKDIVFD